MTESTQQTYEKGEPVPGPGTYRCGECGEIWTTNESRVRFPPCSANKSGAAHWTRVPDDS